MNLRRNNPGLCIFCSFRQASRSFSTTPAHSRVERGLVHKKSAQKKDRIEQQPLRTGANHRHIRFGLQQKPSPRPSEHEPAFDRGPSGSFHKSFKPRRGESFDRNSRDESTMVERRLAALEEVLHDDPILARLRLSKDKMERQFKKFKSSFALPSAGTVSDQEPVNPLLARVNRLVGLRDEQGVYNELKYAFYGSIASSGLNRSDQQHQKQLLNLQYPSEWYPRTRGIQREFHIHVGPTNSGKTYHALKRLEESESGVYAGPLRLLAHEVYMRMNARGKPCDLVTGDEIKHHEDQGKAAQMTSCTVEMVPLNQVFDVAVIDEIQMLGSEDRGWAWTQALLGVMAREVHVCGEERAVPIIEELAAACGDTIKIHRYERLSPLQMMPRSLEGNLKSLQKGDCIVGFSIVVLHGLRQYVEQSTGKKCAIIYGTLPPETRTQQASLFNDPNNDYDFLVASNAVGMGLNLSIKRLIFQSAHRNIRGVLEAISVPEIKQIAGRAGRYSTASQDMKASTDSQSLSATGKTESVVITPTDIFDGAQGSLQGVEDAEAVHSKSEVADSKISVTSSAESINPSFDSSHIVSSVGERTTLPANLSDIVHKASPAPSSKSKTLGLVTTLERVDYPVVAKAMATDPVAMSSAGVLPPSSVIQEFSRYYPAGTPLSFLLLRLKEIAGTNRRFFLCDLKSHVAIADAIETVQGLTIADRLEFCAAPIETRREGESDLARAYASMVGNAMPANVLDIEQLNLELLEDDYTADRAYLKQLETLHKGLIIFNWLAYRFTGVFQDQALAVHVKELVEKRIEETLGQMSFDYKKIRKSRHQAILDLLEDKVDTHDPPNTRDEPPGSVHHTGQIGDRAEGTDVQFSRPEAQNEFIVSNQNTSHSTFNKSVNNITTINKRSDIPHVHDDHSTTPSVNFAG